MANLNEVAGDGAVRLIGIEPQLVQLGARAPNRGAKQGSALPALGEVVRIEVGLWETSREARGGDIARLQPKPRIDRLGALPQGAFKVEGVVESQQANPKRLGERGRACRVGSLLEIKAAANLLEFAFDGRAFRQGDLGGGAWHGKRALGNGLILT